MNWITTLTTIPADGLKAIGTIAAAATLGLATYLMSRFTAPKKKPDEASTRIALSPEDRDLAYSLVRTGTDLTRALHTHGELLGKLVKSAPMPRVRRRAPAPRDKNERPMP